ncbi:MAG: DinB family protein [Candidatus Thorarchaeota archaeon]|nr:DinB family protein [Candidatus Thorarchaeota archaeon]
MERILRYMTYNRDDLMTTVRGLDDLTMDRIPTGKSRSIRDILSHVRNAEEFYVSKLGPEADAVYEGHLGMPVSRCDKLPVVERLPVVRSSCIQTLRDMIPKRGSSVFRRKEYTLHPEEEWTGYKVLRRFLEHEQEHIYNIRGYLGCFPRGCIA